jgi:hypothetical protein
MSGDINLGDEWRADINLVVVETSTLMSGDINLDEWRHQP